MDSRQSFALVAAIRRGLEALQWLADHSLPVSREHLELCALMAGELAELLEALAGGELA